MKTNAELSAIFPTSFLRKCDLPDREKREMREAIAHKYREEFTEAIRNESVNVLLDYAIIYYLHDEPQMVIFYCVSVADHVWVKFCVRDLVDDFPDGHNPYDQDASETLAGLLWEKGFKALTHGLVKEDLTHVFHDDLPYPVNYNCH